MASQLPLLALALCACIAIAQAGAIPYKPSTPVQLEQGRCEYGSRVPLEQRRSEQVD